MNAPAEAGAGVVASEIPLLPPRCGSWIVTAHDGTVLEFFDKANVQKAANHGWKIETAIDYLHRINAEIKTGAKTP